MNNIELKLEQNGRGAFVMEEANERLAEIAFGINGKNLIVYHTEVSDKLKGQGVASQLLGKMINYVREHKLQVVPLCPYVNAQFNKHPEEYADIWNKDWHDRKS